MEKIKVLSWFAYENVKKGLKKVDSKGKIIYKDLEDFGMSGACSANLNQENFDRILHTFNPEIIILIDRTSRNLSVDIPREIKVITFCDHYHEQFCKFGQAFFNMLPENNYLCHIILDAQNIDRDHVLDNETLKRQMFFTPFLPCVDELVEEEVCDRYACDISVMLRHKTINFYAGCEGINTGNFLGKLLMHFLGEIIASVRREINGNETAYMEDELIQRLLLSTMDRLHIGQYIRDYDEFIRYWFNEIKYSVIPTEYGNCVVDWLVEKDYNIKIYGAEWQGYKKYDKYAFGKIPDGSSELRKAYRHSKINVSANIDMGIHRRVFEAMENGSLCLQAEAKREWMVSDWRHYFTDGKDIVIYRNKKELYEKIDYLLSNETVRKRITEAAKERIKTCPDIADILENVIMEVYQR